MRAAVVTGASSGIGEVTARRLDRDGWSLLLVARRAKRLEALAAELEDARALAADLTDDDAGERVAAEVEQRFGQLDLLVNNAGAARRARFADPDAGLEAVRWAMEVNFFAPVRVTQALLPILRRSAPSSIVNVGSIAGRVGMAKSGAYNGAKFALSGWSEALRFEEAEHGVHVGLVLPGFIRTEGFPHDDLRGSPKTRWMVSGPEQVAEAILAAGPGGKAEVSVPRPYGLVLPLRALVPPLWRRLAHGMRR